APARAAGLYHFALNYPSRKDLANALKRLLQEGHPIDGAADHTTHLALYLRDPDGNGIELAWDRDPSFWTYMTDGSLTLEKVLGANQLLDVEALLREADEEERQQDE
ncbi:VOC family protein, partial [Flaviaesturariibacter aridisoli]